VPDRAHSEEMTVKRMSTAVFIAAMIVLSVSAQAKDAKLVTVAGELVDTGCFLAHEAKGPSNADCGTKCVSAGMPMGVLTSKGELYLVTLNHDNPDSYNKLKGMVGENVSVTGAVYQRAGLRAIEATSAKSGK